MAITTPLVAQFQALREYAGSLGWSSFLQLSKTALHSVLGRIQIGRLDIVEVDGNVLQFGENEPEEASRHVVVRVHNEMFWVRLALYADMVRLN